MSFWPWTPFLAARWRGGVDPALLFGLRFQALRPELRETSRRSGLLPQPRAGVSAPRRETSGLGRGGRGTWGLRCPLLPTPAPNKCELHCIPKGESFYYKHREAVVDGTPCEPGGRDVCVEGRCRVSVSLAPGAGRLSGE